MFNAEYVSTEDGTGIVHIAPAFGEEDHKVFAGSGVPEVEPIDAECRFTKEIPEYQGRFVKDCDKEIIQRLKEIQLFTLILTAGGVQVLLFTAELVHGL